MVRPSHSIEDRLLAAQIAIHNALDDVELQDYLAKYSYGRAKLEAGQALYEAVQRTQQVQKAKYGDQYDATDTMNRLWKDANKVYMRYVKVARIALRDQQGAMSKLSLRGQRKRTIAGWLVQARQFYSNLLAEAELLAQMAEYGITQAKLEAGQAQVDDVEQAHHVQKQKRGQAQAATQARDATLDALSQWVSDFISIARLALQERPQYLEKLGVVVRS